MPILDVIATDVMVCRTFPTICREIRPICLRGIRHESRKTFIKV
jgi:hypothetical protein